MKRRTFIAICMVVGLTVITGLMGPRIWRSYKYRPDAGREDHGTYHDCQWNRDAIMEPAKEAFAKARGLTNGTPVKWEDLVSYITNVGHHASIGYPGTPPDFLPKCPSGGKYSINPVGSNVVCSHPYHQWYNCMWKNPKD